MNYPDEEVSYPLQEAKARYCAEVANYGTSGNANEEGPSRGEPRSGGNEDATENYANEEPGKQTGGRAPHAHGALIFFVAGGSPRHGLCGLTFELTGPLRRDGLARAGRMYRVPQAGPRRPAVAGPVVQRGVRPHPRCG